MQIQLDIEGFFLNTVYEYYLMTKDKMFIRENWDIIRYIAEWEDKNWRLRDAGIWEDRGKLRHYTHSKVMMWVAMDRAEKLAKEINEKVTWNKNELREWIMENNVKEGYFVQHSETNEVDASLLTLPLYGFCSINDPVFLKTLKKIESDLVLNGYVKRYRFDSLGEARYPFSLTTIWLARVYNMLGRDSSQIIKNVFKPLIFSGRAHRPCRR